MGNNVIVLQKERTLDDVILSSVKTFRNGCNYNLVKESDGLYYLVYGCYGVHVNLVTGDSRLLYNWFIKTGEDKRKLSGEVTPETIHHLLKQKPCGSCGGAKFSSNL
jgi:hypothetical protein